MSEPHEVIIIKACSGLLQVLEVLYIVYGGQVHILLPAVLLIIDPAQILVHLRVGFGDRKRARRSPAAGETIIDRLHTHE